MRILVTGGNGSVGRELVPALLARDHEVAVLDPELGALERIPSPRLRLVRGGVEDRAAVRAAIAGADAAIHLAWSFSDDPAVLVAKDLLGNELLLEAARAAGVRHLLYASSAVVYGKAARLPVGEDHPLRVLEARKPAYAIAKEAAEKLCLLAGRTGGPQATILRFWWAFGDEIAGRHLRDLLAAAAAGKRLEVPAGCGGSFLSMGDLVDATLAALLEPAAFGETFNLASAYVTWEEIARMALDATGSRAGVEVVSPQAFAGPAFLADSWPLDVARIRERLAWQPSDGADGVKASLGRAVRRTWARVSAAARATAGVG
jgi:UDP-glucose 4-epimerase